MSTAATLAEDPIDWPAVRTLSVAVGVREAARRMGLNEERVKKRCTREGWLSDPAVRAATERSVALRNSMSPIVPATLSAAQAMTQELAQLNAKSRIGVARGLAKAATHIESMDGQEIVMDASNVKQTVQSLALVHGWSANQAVTKVSLSITGAHEVSVEATSDAIDAEWSDEQVVGDERVDQ
jgi:hypothetical protein